MIEGSVHIQVQQGPAVVVPALCETEASGATEGRSGSFEEEGDKSPLFG